MAHARLNWPKPKPQKEIMQFCLYGYEGGMQDPWDDSWVLLRGMGDVQYQHCGTGYRTKGGGYSVFQGSGSGDGLLAGMIDDEFVGWGAGFYCNWQHELVEGGLF